MLVELNFLILIFTRSIELIEDYLVVYKNEINLYLVIKEKEM